MTPTQSDREAAANLYLALEGRPYNRYILAEAEQHRTGEYDAHPTIIAFAAHRIASTAALTAENAALKAEVARLREGLGCAVGHLEHMSSWISEWLGAMGVSKRIYSFESLGEDMPNIRAALTTPAPAASDVEVVA